MANSRTNARITGILLILGTVPVIAAMLLWGQAFSSPDLLSAVASSRVQTVLFAFAIMVMGLACAGIGISLYPVLKRHNEGLAVAAMGLRLMEGTLQVASAIGYFALLALAQEFVKAGSPPNSFYQPAAAAINAVNNWASNVYVPGMCLAALIYYSIFYRTRLIPRWLSLWGLVGIPLMLLSSLLGMLCDTSPVVFLLNMPILLQELVLAVWLIVKGYRE